MATRKVIATRTGHPAIDGAGVHLIRVIGYREVKLFDPFLMLDAFDSRNPDDYTKGFPWHPHRGIETVTYLIEGHIDHGDSLGNRGSIVSGSCQWMTAGCGIMHQEMPQATEHLRGLQLWLNLPHQDKMTEPKYFDIKADMVKAVKEAGRTVRIISGTYNGVEGVRSHHIPTLMLDVTVDPGETFTLPTDPQSNLFVYILEGDGRFGEDGETIPARTAVLFDKAEVFSVRAGDQGVRFMLFAARPLGEPVAWGGPIVMNTPAELDEAFRELDKGTFIKDKMRKPTP